MNPSIKWSPGMSVSNNNRTFTVQLLIILLEIRWHVPFSTGCVYKTDVPHALLPLLPGSHCKVKSQYGDTQETGRWHSRITNHLLFIGSYILSQLHAYSMSQSVFWGEHETPNYLPVPLAPFSFPWHIGTVGLFVLTSRRVWSVNLSQWNLYFSKNRLQGNWIWKH